MSNKKELGLREQIRRLETKLILNALKAKKGNISQASEVLKIPRVTLIHKINRLNLRVH